MRLLLIFTFIFSLSSVLASDCREVAILQLKSETEKMLFKNQIWSHDFIDCTSKSFGMEVVIHEAAHGEDIGIPAGMTMEEVVRWLADGNNFNFNLLLIDGRRLGEMQTRSLPSPNSLIMNYIRNFYPEVLEETESVFYFYLYYISNPELLASQSFAKGLTLEFNGYMHGLNIEERILKGSDTLRGQRFGIYAFMFYFKAYLFEFEKDYPYLWEKFRTSDDVQQVVALFEQAARVLKESNHCKTMNDTETYEFYPKLLRTDHLGALSEILESRPEILEKILCPNLL